MFASILIKQVLTKYALPIQQALRIELAEIQKPHPSISSSLTRELEPFYGQMSYHLGWVDAQFSPIQPHSGKMLRSMLLLSSYEAAGSWKFTPKRGEVDHLQRALPAAVAIELFHNFTLLHDDIEDRDRERRHRPTVWFLWGIPYAINTGDGLNCLSRLALSKLLDVGVDVQLFSQLGICFDRACLLVTEGQHLDLCFETQEEVTIAQYLDMITRKTAALMACATEMGARLGSDDEQMIKTFRQFGLQLGIAFQIRDDLLGIWGTREEAGKTPAGDLLCRKKTLPVLHAFQQASPEDLALLDTLYQQRETFDQEQIGQILDILQRTRSWEYCQHVLRERCALAEEALQQLPETELLLTQEARTDLAMLIKYVAEDFRQVEEEAKLPFSEKQCS